MTDDTALPSCRCKQYVSDEESAILARMRELRAEVSGLRDRLQNELEASPNRQALEESLDGLRARFDELKAELKLANRDKMLRLGHRP